jgi:predicted nucleic-acid-binding Zn-ribbon protein
MRTTATCPKCSGKKIVVTDLRYVDHGEGWIATDRIPAVAYDVQGRAKSFGRFESWICAACGYTEFYAKDLGDVDKLTAERPEDVRIVDATVPARGPFR